MIGFSGRLHSIYSEFSQELKDGFFLLAEASIEPDAFEEAQIQIDRGDMDKE